MGRPKPRILLECPRRGGKLMAAILEADAIYAVFYRGAPMSLRISQVYVDYPGPKYPRVSLSLGHCFNLADRLNKEFKTTDFQVYRLTSGTPMTEELE